MDTPTNDSAHGGTTHERVAENVKALRQRRGLSQAELSRRLDALGNPIGVSALSKVENGTRRVTVDDLVALAISLDVTPNRLLLFEDVEPVPPDPQFRDEEPVDLAGSVSVDAWEAWSWATGVDPIRPDPWADETAAPDYARPFRFKQENRPHDPPSREEFESTLNALEDAKRRSGTAQEFFDRHGFRLLAALQRYPEVAAEIIDRFEDEES